MAKGSEQASKPGWGERLIGIDEGIHGTIGAVALADTVITGSAVAETIAAFELVHTLVLEGLRRVIKRFKKNS